jgi:hypothetical protein
MGSENGVYMVHFPEVLEHFAGIAEKEKSSKTSKGYSIHSEQFGVLEWRGSLRSKQARRV